ncbi:30S ribosomal protein S8e [Halorientalis regularis]|jgi:small subunit ribosomal protein S8e|uniref:Small ribosomal subunit protein eS8 n=1 Tax=Halorientalis regularis TaxID=660518 RepID=A0A1G7M7U5_9EURY|nr:30S ribosomal protein S8e [Halorientalis regularis]SDF57813.1 SSU ribosomal protein S8E [Halorientalis regularis]
MKDQGRSTRKRTGGRLRPNHKKKKHELGDEPTETQVGDAKLKFVDKRGNTEKIRAIEADTASVATDGEVVAAEIENVEANDANPNYARRNIITKGAILETSEGRVRVTSRPGQDGQVNGVLVDE